MALALPPESTICVPPLSIVAPLARPKSTCVPPLICAPRSVPPVLTVSLPPELTVVADAVPPESTNIEPPLTTTSLVSLWPDETLYGEFPELTVTVLMEKLHR